LRHKDKESVSGGGFVTDPSGGVYDALELAHGCYASDSDSNPDLAT